MRNMYPYNDICISIICTYLIVGNSKKGRCFYLKHIILLFSFWFGDKVSGKALEYASLVPGVSVVIDFDYEEKDYRPLANNADFSVAGNSLYWEIFSGGVWTSVANSPQSVKPSRIIIDKTGITGGASAANTYNDIIILPGGELILEDDVVIPSQIFLNTNQKIEVQSGGTLIIQGEMKLSENSNLIVKNGGLMILDQNSISNAHEMWNGMERFEEGSTVIIKDWKWDAMAAELCLVSNLSSITNNADGYKFGNLILDVDPIVEWTIIGGPAGIINLCQNDLVIHNSSGNFISGASSETGVNGFIINGNMTISEGPFSFGSAFSSSDFNHQFVINGNFECKGDNSLKIHHSVMQPASLHGFVTFKGNVTIAASVSSFTNDAASISDSRMYINFEGGTFEKPLLVDIAPTVVAISMNVKSNSYVRFQGHDLETNSIQGNTAIFTVENGATLDFNWAPDGITPLVIKKKGLGGTNQFVSTENSILKISSPDGLQEGSTTGNVQYASSNKAYNQLATFWYVGKTDQVTGDGLGISSNGRVVIIDMDNNSLSTILTRSFGFTDATAISESGGKLEIRKGQFIETATAFVNGTADGDHSGTLYMSDGTLYKIASLSSADVEGMMPRMAGVKFPYKLDGGTIELAAAGDQVLRGARDYRSLVFSNKGIKTVSSAPSSITGTIGVTDAAILDVGIHTMGGEGTNLTMSGTSQYINAGVGAKPDARGTYLLGAGTTIEFTNSGNATMQTIRLGTSEEKAVVYNHIIVSGDNVGNVSLASTPISMRSSSVFRVTTGGVFRHQNVNGFSGSANTCITDVPAVILEEGSTIEYFRDDGAGQNISNQEPYKNILLSGSGNKTAPPGILTVQGDLIETGSAQFIHNNGTVVFSGSGVEIYKSGNPVSFYNLTNNNATGVSINSSMEVYKELFLGPGSKTILEEGNIILRSDKNNTANVAAIPADAKIIYHAGRFAVERFINTGLTINGQHSKSWQFLSAPAFGESVLSTWQENKTDIQNYGIWITNNDFTNWNEQGFDGYSSGPSMKIYDAGSNNWNGIANTHINIENKKGYMVFIRGDRSVTASGQNAKPTTLRSIGKLYSPETGCLPPSVTVPANSYESVGNPYASRIDWEYMFNNGLLAGIDPCFYVWDPLLYGSYGVGGYQTISKSLGYKPVPGIPGRQTGYYDPAFKSGFIESGQAFFVHNSTTISGNVSFTEDCKAKESRLVNRGAGNAKISEILKSYLFTEAGIIADGNAVIFDTCFSSSVDMDDAGKIMNTGENFGLSRSGKVLAVEARKPVQDRDTVFYHLQNLVRQNYHLQFVAMNQNSMYATLLVDKFNKKTTSLNLSDSPFLNFSVTDDPASAAKDRFMLVFIRDLSLPVSFISLKAYRQNLHVVIEWKAANENNISNYVLERSKDGNNFNLSHEETVKHTIPNDYHWVDVKPYNGYNFYRIRITSLGGEVKFSEVVRVNMKEETPSIIVQPNPIQKGIVTLQFINQPAGIYKVKLFNSSGQLIIQKEIAHTNGNSTESISYSKYAPPGIYQLQINKKGTGEYIVQIRIDD